ncbi:MULTISPECIES: DNA polymerase III subunit delta' [unclassified Undibacterium]|uniref:DNA polymerase III subunit delta' n=1 Tax=unclassified Undibacterium TaxID=2630295 RepID=UPI002AC9C21B|nr:MULTISPECIES: DNA polymerase III subunit delta' [unclassified Undibacterium]MEB0139517.1 DNA polymerase III subunit delta' [Undibacterium sp. CCC2.1]MEB0172374.1 DNA polymerase III subunit delta' [Undibacterium sp. CCC1.1]MEB0175701.1 DNA polymerase III subunit delta' [Undibacterium sp. CCC3.4]MEB0214489.1 DNA polymerase III subunit delta' [Undibacterium sp. 5I2]WPX42884.1 DNA polymerase III subunit delta' [Undibacterium sp. CCC3.4]
MNQALFSWQEPAWEYFISLRERMPHAFLLHGPQGIGKTVLAEQMAQSLLCDAPDARGHACQQCGSCNWFRQYSHPDYRRVRPELLDEEEASAADVEPEAGSKSAKASKAPSKEIVINQIRALADFMNLSTHRQGRRVIVLYPAEALNVPAANALLKSLEEPGAATVFILVTHSPDKLLPTILSRCHQFALGLPAPAQALAWLQQQGVSAAADCLAQQGGAPLAALELAQSERYTEIDEFLRQLCKPAIDVSLKLAEKMQKSEMPVLVSALQRWLYDIFSFKQSGRIRYHPRYERELKGLAARVDGDALLKLIDNTNERQAIANHPLSAKLFLEDMLLEYSALFA